MTFHQSRDVTVLGAANQVALPMAGNGAVLNFRGPFPDGDGIDDLPTAVSARRGLPRAAYTPLRPKVLNQLLFQHSSRLNEQAAVNGFVRHAHAFVLGIPPLQPSGNLFRRPIQDQFTRNDRLQLHVNGQKARLGPQGRLPGLLIGFMGSIERSPAMAGGLSAHRRNSPLQTFGYFAHRRTGSDPSWDVLSLGQREAS